MDVVKTLMVMSVTIKGQEAAESRLLQSLSMDDPQGDSPDDIYQEGLKIPEILIQRIEIEQILNSIGEVVPRLKGRKDDLSD